MISALPLVPRLGTDLSLETSRLILRRFVPEDAAAVHAYMSDPEVTRWLDGAWLSGGVFDLTAAQGFVAAHTTEEAHAFAVVEKQEIRLVGHMAFHPWGEAKNRTFEIGWVFGRPAHGRGYATEVAAALLDLAFTRLGLHRVIATCQPENRASRRVAEKIGMRCEGLFRKCISHGEDVWWDELFYAVLAEEYGGDRLSGNQDAPA